MKYDLVIAYRICPRLSKNSAGPITDKFEFSQFCLDSFRRSLSGLNVKIFALLDDCPKKYEELFINNFNRNDLEIIHTKLGNKGTFNKQIEILLKQSDSEIVFFAEDDYFYIKDLKNMVDLIRSKKADFVTPYEHPACYTDGHIIKNKTLVFKEQIYISVQHACLTFMTTKKNLLENKRYLQIFPYWFGSDFVVWGCITLGSTYFKYLKLLPNYKNFTLINLKVYGSMFLFAFHRFIFNKKYILFMPRGSFGTHMEKNFLAPNINWNKYFLKHE
jgi:hypothetical protein